MIGTFCIVLVFTSLKEGYEDLARHRQDSDLNNKQACIFNEATNQFKLKRWADIKAGELIKVLKDEEFPADIILIKSDQKSGIVFVDTKNLDGETNLKEKMAPKEINTMPNNEVEKIQGSITCDSPNELIDKFDGNVSLHNRSDSEIIFNLGTKSLLLRGCRLKNTEYCYGFVLYTGPEAKIMMNAKKPPTKISNMQRAMNKMLYSVFAFQLILILIYAALSIAWKNKNKSTSPYLDLTSTQGFVNFLIQYLTYWVAYSHLIPISLYVVLEIIKVGQSKLISDDVQLYDQETGFSICRNSDLIEEMGQVEFIFSDKTGTLTCNVMEFKQCAINGKVYQSLQQVNELLSGHFKQQSTQDPDFKACYEFFKLLAVCHSVVIDVKATGESNMQAASPDELALVQGAKDVGFVFVEKTSEYIGIRVEYANSKEIEKFQVLAEFPFDSTRKRMSLVVRELSTQKIFIMTKGADSIMLPRTTISKKDLQEVNEQLYTFACTGLRTLVMGQKQINEGQFNQWFTRFQKLTTSNDPTKEEQLNTMYDDMEADLTYIGCSAIEDLLQDEVPETIRSLMSAGIRVWVLTGDKQETAIEIGKSCNLINEAENMEQVILSSNDAQEFESKLSDAIQKRKQLLEKGFEQKMCIVVDGFTLTLVLEQIEVAQRFFQFGCKANSVICCRVSPKQKSDVVALAKKNGKWITLSVGDGANDVPMIMEAHIGVGIRGKEGTQAVRSADYAIGQFKFLRKLILVHGRWGYRRIGVFICYYFYKNVILVFCELYFAFYNGFSGQIYYADWLPMLYNVLWTAWPPIFTFIFERDVDVEFSLRYPILYAAGPNQYYFNYKTFWKWMFQAIYHGFVVFFIVQFGFQGIGCENGQTNDHWFLSCISFTILLHVATYKLLLESYYWSIIQIMAAAASLLTYYIIVLLGSTNGVATIFQPQLNGLFYQILASGKVKLFTVNYLQQCWLAFLTIPIICLLPDITVIFIGRIFLQTPADRLMLIQKQTQSSKNNLTNQNQILTVNESKVIENETMPLYTIRLDNSSNNTNSKMKRDNDMDDAWDFNKQLPVSTKSLIRQRDSFYGDQNNYSLNNLVPHQAHDPWDFSKNDQSLFQDKQPPAQVFKQNLSKLKHYKSQYEENNRSPIPKEQKSRTSEKKYKNSRKKRSRIKTESMNDIAKQYKINCVQSPIDGKYLNTGEMQTTNIMSSNEKLGSMIRNQQFKDNCQNDATEKHSPTKDVDEFDLDKIVKELCIQ